MVLERKRQVVRLTSTGGAPWKLTPPLGFKARILALNWQGTMGNIYDQCVVTASVGGDVFWAVNQVFYSNTPRGCFVLGGSYTNPIAAYINAFPVVTVYYEGNSTSALPDFYWEEQTVLIAVAMDAGTVTTASLVYELVPL